MTLSCLGLSLFRVGSAPAGCWPIHNLRTGSITPSFHVVHDGRFHTAQTTGVATINVNKLPGLLSVDYYIGGNDPIVDGPIPGLAPKWQPASQSTAPPIPLPVREGENSSSSNNGLQNTEPPTNVINYDEQGVINDAVDPPTTTVNQGEDCEEQVHVLTINQDMNATDQDTNVPEPQYVDIQCEMMPNSSASEENNVPPLNNNNWEQGEIPLCRCNCRRRPPQWLDTRDWVTNTVNGFFWE